MTNAYIRALMCAGILTVGLPQIGQAQAQQEPSNQQQSAQQAPPAAAAPETVTSADVGDQELEQFAKSIQEVIQIQQDTNKQLESVQDSAGVAKVKQEANQKTQALKLILSITNNYLLIIAT